MIIKFQCNNPTCDNSINKFFRNAKDVPPFLDCGECGSGKLERQISAPFSKGTIIVDNGKQQRQVEVNNDIVEQERDRIIKKG